MSVMLEAPHFRNACLVYTIQFCILFGYDWRNSSENVSIFLINSLNTFRLWVVQLFAIIKEYENEFTLDGDSVSATLCTMIEFKVNKTQLTIVDVPENADIVCEPVRQFFLILKSKKYFQIFFLLKNLDPGMFSNSMIISVIQLGFYLIASYLINMVGNKNIIGEISVISSFINQLKFEIHRSVWTDDSRILRDFPLLGARLRHHSCTCCALHLARQLIIDNSCGFNRFDVSHLDKDYECVARNDVWSVRSHHRQHDYSYINDFRLPSTFRIHRSFSAK